MKNVNYRYVVTPTKIIALSTYAGRPVRGIAKCHPNDTFDEEFGKKLAATRCNVKVAQKRFERATNKYNEMVEEIHRLNVKSKKIIKYLEDSYAARTQAMEELNSLWGEIDDH